MYGKNDIDKSIYWYEKSAEQGNKTAQDELAKIYEKIRKDKDKPTKNLLSKVINKFK